MAVFVFVCVFFVFLIASPGLTHAFVIKPVVSRALSAHRVAAGSQRIEMFRRPIPLVTHSRRGGHRHLVRTDDGREDEDVPVLQWDEESEELEEEESSDEIDDFSFASMSAAADREGEREREPSVDELAAMEEELLHMEGEICAEDDLSEEERAAQLSFADLASSLSSAADAACGGGADDRVGASLVRAAMLDGRERSMRADGQFMD